MQRRSLGQASTANGNLQQQLLDDLYQGTLTAQQAQAIYASLAFRRTIASTDRTLIRIEPNDQSEGMPTPVSIDSLPAAWRTVCADTGAQSDESSKSTSLDLRWERSRDKALLAKRKNRNAALLRSQHFLFEVDTLPKTWQGIVQECESTYAALAAMLELKDDAQPLNVQVLRTRASYVRLLSKASKQIELTNGYFDSTTNTVYCFWAEDTATRSALRHEVTHQILANVWSRGITIDWARQTDFWAFEAMATYMESLSLRPGVDESFIMLGGWESPRLQAARYRRLHDMTWMPWPQLRGTSRDAYQQPIDIQIRYSQTAGLAHYFFDSSRESREQFLRYAESVHRGSPDVTLLEIESDDELRAAYDTFLLGEQSSFRAYALQPPRADLVLSRTAITDEILAKWPTSHRSFEWLDLSYTKVDGSFLSNEHATWSARRFNLESTNVDDAAFDAILTVQGIEELDLSNCNVTDSSIKKLRAMKGLRKLWLTGTTVTDAVLEPLGSLPNLVYIDVQGTAISREAWLAFQKSHPRIK